MTTDTSAKKARTAAFAQHARPKLKAAIAAACRAHELYLAEYGSLSDAIRTDHDVVRGDPASLPI